MTLGNVVFCSMLGYALAKLEFRGKRIIFVLVLGMLMVPAIAILVPLFVLVSNLGLTNTYPGLILPFLAGAARCVPDAAVLPRHAGRADPGSPGRWRRRVSHLLRASCCRLCGPALATLAILTFLGSWNNFLWPLVVAQTEDRYTLPVALALYSVGQNATQYGAAACRRAVVVVLPVIAIFLALQRYFVQGIATTGIK